MDHSLWPAVFSEKKKINIYIHTIKTKLREGPNYYTYEAGHTFKTS